MAVAAAAGLGGGFVNTLAGGGSMLMVPALMLSGLPADAANATSRVPIFAQCATSATAFARAGKLERAPALDVAPLAIVGALVGAYVATLVPNRIFEPMLVGTMIVMALTMLLQPDTLAPPPGTEPRPVLGRPVAMVTTLAAGFYGGVLQAGAGLVFLALLSGLLRYDLVRANALKAIVMLAYISVTVAVFAIRELIWWDMALAMMVGAVIGAWIGAKFALGRGQAWIRWIVVAMVIATCVWVLVR
jgi:uncharacterized membrane protein YfcA